MRQIADVTLIERSSAGNPPKVFTGQTADIRRQDISTHMSADGLLTADRHPSTVKWFGGNATDFDHITNVLIVAPDGTIVIDAEILRNFKQPHAINSGVQFQVM
jgi:hypothetical protein